MHALSLIETPAPMPARIAAFEAAAAAYSAAIAAGDSHERATAAARNRALRALQVMDGARAIATLAIAACIAPPAREALAMPDPPAAAAPVAARKARAARLPRAAYRDAEATRAALDSDLRTAFDRTWRSLWPSKGRATLAEAFGEWCESHPGDLAEMQISAAEKSERALVREVDRMHRDAAAAARAVELEQARRDAAYEADERAAIAGVPF